MPNACNAVANLDDRLVELANQHGAELVYGLEDHRRYGRLFCQVLTERGRELRVVKPFQRARRFHREADYCDCPDGLAPQQ